jgi:hypothetical protein
MDDARIPHRALVAGDVLGTKHKSNIKPLQRNGGSTEKK